MNVYVFYLGLMTLIRLNQPLLSGLWYITRCWYVIHMRALGIWLPAVALWPVSYTLYGHVATRFVHDVDGPSLVPGKVTTEDYPFLECPWGETRFLVSYAVRAMITTVAFLWLTANRWPTVDRDRITSSVAVALGAAVTATMSMLRLTVLTAAIALWPGMTSQVMAVGSLFVTAVLAQDRGGLGIDCPAFLSATLLSACPLPGVLIHLPGRLQTPGWEILEWVPEGAKARLDATSHAP